jgi:transcription initiation factor TFIIH subunit 4
MLSFFSKELYEDTRDEAKRNAGLQHCDDAQKIIFIEPTIREAIREFIQARQSELRALRR